MRLKKKLEIAVQRDGDGNITNEADIDAVFARAKDLITSPITEDTALLHVEYGMEDTETVRGGRRNTEDESDAGGSKQPKKPRGRSGGSDSGGGSKS